MRNAGRVVIAIALIAILAIAVGGCAPSSTAPSGTTTTTPSGTAGTIRVGSKIDIEGSLLGQMIIAMLRANGFTVVDDTRTGATDVVRKALLTGQIDIYPEYTANGVLVFLKDQNIDPAVLKSATQTYDTVKTLDLKVNNVVWLQPAPANNTWAVALTKKFATANHISSMADWAAYINAGKPVKIVGSRSSSRAAPRCPPSRRRTGSRSRAARPSRWPPAIPR